MVSFTFDDIPDSAATSPRKRGEVDRIRRTVLSRADGGEESVDFEPEALAVVGEQLRRRQQFR